MSPVVKTTMCRPRDSVQAGIARYPRTSSLIRRTALGRFARASKPPVFRQPFRSRQCRQFMAILNTAQTRKQATLSPRLHEGLQPTLTGVHRSPPAGLCSDATAARSRRSSLIAVLSRVPVIKFQGFIRLSLRVWSPEMWQQLALQRGRWRG